MSRPLRAGASPRPLPWVVVAIALIDVALFAHTTLLATPESIAFVERWGLVPRSLPRAFAHPESAGLRPWLTLITSTFLHGDALHLAGNLIYLSVFGAEIERQLGHARFALFCLVCGSAASALHVVLAPDSWVVTLGASGIVSGLLGAYLVGHPGERMRLRWPDLRVPLHVFVGLWIALQLLSGFVSLRSGSGGVAWWAHVGGFGAGAALGHWLHPARARERS